VPGGSFSLRERDRNAKGPKVVRKFVFGCRVCIINNGNSNTGMVGEKRGGGALSFGPTNLDEKVMQGGLGGGGKLNSCNTNKGGRGRRKGKPLKNNTVMVKDTTTDYQEVKKG